MLFCNGKHVIRVEVLQISFTLNVADSDNICVWPPGSEDNQSASELRPDVTLPNTCLAPHTREDTAPVLCQTFEFKIFSLNSNVLNGCKGATTDFLYQN